MESAKKNLQLIVPPSETIAQSKEDVNSQEAAKTEVSDQEKVEISQIPPPKIEEREKPKGETVSKSKLINKLNYTNFQDRTLLINFKHRSYDKTLTLLAKPQPCLGDLLDCLWTQRNNLRSVKQNYDFCNLLLIDGNKLLLVEPQLIHLDQEGISFLLPETCYEVSSRTTKRHLCEGIAVQFIQHSSLFSGTLLDFNARSFRVELTTVPPQRFDWINPETTVNIILSKGQETLYAEECRIIRKTSGQQTRTYILEPLKHEIQRFKNKEYRSYRYELTPSPNIIFRHPFTNKIFDHKVIDLSGSGFSVEEDENNAVLLPGLIIPELELNFANSFKIKCRAQVVYRKLIEEKKKGNWVKCGLTLLDMDIQDHDKLIALLHQVSDGNTYICNNVDLDELWDFFFETGFIYPDKYSFIQKNKEEIKKTYEKLYTRNPHIARHIIYQVKRRIMGHMAMIRFYKKTWLIHHHAARKSALNKAGLIVLDQIGRLIHESYRLHSLNMDYLMCYYRGENKFPSRVFGGAARSINDPKGCSIDEFAYYHHQRELSHKTALPKSWELVESQPEDLQELEDFYQHIAGGIMIRALDLKPDRLDIHGLSEEYQRIGLKRNRYLFSLKKQGVLNAILMLNVTDLGLNLSDLTNCIQIFILDSDGLPPNVLFAALSIVSETYEQMEVPVLLYPVKYANKHQISYEKQYNLWIIDLQYEDLYFRYLNRLLRFV